MAAEIGEITSDKVAIEQFFGPAAVVDTTDLAGQGSAGQSPIIHATRLREWETTHGEFQAGEVVLFRTGWSNRYYKPFPEGNLYAWTPGVERTQPAWPSPDEEALHYLHRRGIGMVGIDAPTIGPLQSIKEVHQAGLQHGMIYVESLIHLDQLPQRGALFVFLPIKCENGSGAPGRAVALVAQM